MYVVKPEDGELPVRVGQRCAAVKPLCASREPLAGVVGSRQSDVDAEVSRLAEVIGASQVIHPTEPFGGVQTEKGVGHRVWTSAPNMHSDSTSNSCTHCLADIQR